METTKECISVPECYFEMSVMNGIKCEHLETRHYFHNMFSRELWQSKRETFTSKTSDRKNISLLVVIHETWTIITENDYLQLPDQQTIGTAAFKYAKNSIQELAIGMPNLLKY